MMGGMNYYIPISFNDSDNVSSGQLDLLHSSPQCFFPLLSSYRITLSSVKLRLLYVFWENSFPKNPRFCSLAASSENPHRCRLHFDGQISTIPSRSMSSSNLRWAPLPCHLAAYEIPITYRLVTADQFADVDENNCLQVLGSFESARDCRLLRRFDDKWNPSLEARRTSMGVFVLTIHYVSFFWATLGRSAEPTKSELRCLAEGSSR